MTAFGAVATGSMNAQEALIAAGTISSSGRMPAATAVAARTGINSEVVAVLLVISVRNVTPRQMLSTISHGGSVASTVNCEATASLSPVSMKPRAMVMPPANSSSTPQGMAPAVCQSSKRPPRPSGIVQRTTTASSATAASLAYGSASHACQPPPGAVRVIQASATSTKITMMRTSAGDQRPGTSSTGSGPASTRRVSHRNMIGSSSATTGTPQLIQTGNDVATWNWSAATCM